MLAPSCQPGSKPIEESEEGKASQRLPAAPAPASPRASRPAAPAAPYTGYHRYRGTVGGRPVTVELTIGLDETYPRKKPTCTGSYYYGQVNAGLLNLSTKGAYQPRQPLRLQEMAGGKASGTWQAAQVAGPVLTGTWNSPAGQTLSFKLREDYTDGQGRLMAVRYEVLQDDFEGPRCASNLQTLYPRATLSRSVLHLLGPDTLLPALRRLQCAWPVQRRAAGRRYVRGDGACCETVEGPWVKFNDFGLLALATGTRQLSYEAGSFGHSGSSAIYDLRGGQELSLNDLLRPGADTLLQKLLTQHLVPDPPGDGKASTRGRYAEGGQLVGLPNEVSLSYTGLVCVYGQVDDDSWEVPWRELQPLLRPDSPVARMLRERGLWRPAGKK